MPLRILTIDEDPELLAQLTDGLRAAGYLAVGVLGWREGLAIHAAEPVDIIIVDLECIAASGGDVLQQFRQVRSTRPVSVIAKGWSGSSESESLADGLGVDAHLSRPVTVPALRVAIEGVVQSPRGASGSTWFVEDVPLEPFDVEFNEPEDPDSVIFR